MTHDDGSESLAAVFVLDDGVWHHHAVAVVDVVGETGDLTVDDDLVA